MMNQIEEFWRPRWYYIAVCFATGMLYIGQCTHPTMDGEKYCGSGSYWRNHCRKYGGHDRSNVGFVFRQWFTDRDEAAEFLKRFEAKEPNYWNKKNPRFANLIPETLEESTGHGLKGLTEENSEVVARMAAGARKTRSSDEYKARVSPISRKAQNRLDVKKKKSLAMSKTWSDPEYRTRQLKAMRTPEAKARMSTGQLQAIARPEVTHNRNVARNKPEVKEKISTAARKNWADPAYRLVHASAMRIANSKPETRSRKSAAQNRAEVKEKKSLSMREAWSAPGYRESHPSARKGKGKHIFCPELNVTFYSTKNAGEFIFLLDSKYKHPDSVSHLIDRLCKGIRKTPVSGFTFCYVA
jgi:hypothetical protein